MPSSGPVSGACSCHSGCSVVGFSSNRFSPPLTVARSHSAPSLHGHYPFLRYYGLSDSRDLHASRVSQVPRLIDFRAPPPTTPESPMAAIPAVSTIGGRLHPLRQTGHSQSLTRLNRVRLRCGSRFCLARLRDADCSNSTRLLGYVDERAISTVSSFQLTS